MSKKINFLFLVCIITLLWVNEASAYLDPGTGSMILQIAIAVIAGLALWIKLFWKNIKCMLSNFVKGDKNKKDEDI